MTFRPTRAALAALVAVGVLAVGCGDDDTASATDPTPVTAPDDAGEIEVVATDFAFANLPDTVTAGTRLTLRDDASGELHELVAFRLPDEETRPADELVSLPPEELGALLGAAPPALVTLAAPGEPAITPVGDGALHEPGRYLLTCMIPTGADPHEHLEAAATSDGPPRVAGGPPHLVHGMWAEVEVVAS